VASDQWSAAQELLSNWSAPTVKMRGQASVPRDAFPPTPPGPEGSNGNGLLRVQWVPGAWLCPRTLQLQLFPCNQNLLTQSALRNPRRTLRHSRRARTTDLHPKAERPVAGALFGHCIASAYNRHFIFPTGELIE
jgi:hypothetical protein